MAGSKRKSKRTKQLPTQTGNRRRIAQFESLESRVVLTTLLPGTPFTVTEFLDQGEVELIDVTLRSALDLDDGDTLVIDTIGSELIDEFAQPANDTELGFFNATGDLLAENDDIDISNNRLSRLEFPADLTAPVNTLVSGNHTIAAAAYDTTFGPGPSASSSSTYSGNLLVNVTLSQNDFGTLTLGTPVSDTDPLIAEEVKFFRFELDADVTAANGASLVIDTLGSDLTMGEFFEDDTEIGLFDESGDSIAVNDDFDGPTSQLSFGAGGDNGDLPAGTYFLAAGSYNTTFANSFEATSDSPSTGDIQVNLTLSTGAILVTTAADSVNAADGVTSLREAIIFANSNAGPDTIEFDTNGAFATPQSIALTMGSELPIDDDVTINGPGKDSLSISGILAHRVFNVDDGDAGNYLSVDINGLTVTQGFASDFGGGIYNSENLTITSVGVTSNVADPDPIGTSRGGGIFSIEGTLSVIDSVLSGNIARRGGAIFGVGNVDIQNSLMSGNEAREGGGAIYGVATVNVEGSALTDNDAQNGGAIFGGGSRVFINDSELSDNTATNDGGGIRITAGQLEVVSSTLSSNTARSTGGGISVESSDSFTLRNSTISGNEAMGIPTVVNAVGGGIYARQHGAEMLIEFSTIANNSSADDSGGVDSAPSTTINNSIIANNTATYYGDVFGALTANFTLIGNSNDGGTIMGSNNLLDVDPQLLPLANNGGPTLTHMPTPGSPVINIGDPSAMVGDGTTPDFDQRGTSYSRVVGGRIDIGAVEVQSVTLACDFDGDGACDGADIDALQANIVTGPADPGTYDLNGDGQVTIADRDEWLALAGAENLTSGNPYLVGDANLDGTVDGGDFLAWNANKFTTSSNWTDGDFNSDGTVDGADFLAWNANKFTSSDTVATRPSDSDQDSNDEEKHESRREQLLDSVFAELA